VTPWCRQRTAKPKYGNASDSTQEGPRLAAAALTRASGWAATALWRSGRWPGWWGYRRLQVRYERRADILLAFLQPACTLICLNRLDRPSAAPRGGRRRAASVPISRRP
jgi:hypothetical protein